MRILTILLYDSSFALYTICRLLNTAPYRLGRQTEVQLPVPGGDTVIVLLSAVVVLLPVRLNVTIPPVPLPGIPPTEPHSVIS